MTSTSPSGSCPFNEDDRNVQQGKSNHEGNSTDTTDESTVCPICLSNDETLVMTSCGHIIGQCCLERLLSSTTIIHNFGIDNNGDNDESTIGEEKITDVLVSSCPTKGKCPMCRSLVDWFDTKYYYAPHNLHETNIQSIQSSKEDSFTIDLVYEKDKNKSISQSPLAGMIFVKLSGTVGQQSLHFATVPPDCNHNNTNTNHDNDVQEIIQLPNFNFESIGSTEKLDNGNPLPPFKNFEEGCFYHEKTNTFHGIIDWTTEPTCSTYKGMHKWQVIIQFSSDFHRIQNGVLIHYKAPKSKQDQEQEQISNNTVFSTPFDGWWIMQFRKKGNVSTDSISERIKIVSNTFYYNGRKFVIDCYGRNTTFHSGDGDTAHINTMIQPHFVWPGMKKADGSDYKITLETKLMMKTNDDECGDVGVILEPDIGSVIVWNTDHPDYHKIIWKRETKGCVPLQKIYLFGPHDSQDRLQYRRFYDKMIRPVPTYHRTKLWGNVFIQQLRVGLASYHFISPDGEGEDGVYISYEHEDCLVWPNLDDGSVVPSRVPFKDIRWDEETRTFEGIIPWKERYNTSWMGSCEWRYKIIFDSEYTCIVGGEVISLNDHDLNNQGIGREMSSYGDTLIYINAAILKELEDRCEHHESSNILILIMRKSREIINRWEEEGVSSRTIAVLQTLVRLYIGGETNLIDYNVD